MIWNDIENENYATAPFLALFVSGFLHTGVMSVAQGWIEPPRFGVRRAPVSEVRSAASLPGF